MKSESPPCCAQVAGPYRARAGADPATDLHAVRQRGRGDLLEASALATDRNVVVELANGARCPYGNGSRFPGDPSGLLTYPPALSSAAEVDRDAAETGLTIVDYVLSLLREGHSGPIVALSRQGLMPRRIAAGLRYASMMRSCPSAPVPVSYCAAFRNISMPIATGRQLAERYQPDQTIDPAPMARASGRPLYRDRFAEFADALDCAFR